MHSRRSKGGTMNVILERYPYRYVECGTLENGFPDYRIQSLTNIHRDIETCISLDNSTQLDYAMEDFEYTKWLDPDPEVAAYAHNRG